MPGTFIFDSNYFQQYIVHVNRKNNLPIPNLNQWRFTMGRFLAVAALVALPLAAATLFSRGGGKPSTEEERQAGYKRQAAQRAANK